MTLRALIVDDERLSRLALRQLLAATPDVEVGAECRDIAEAEPRLSDADVVFLDIQMPRQSGLAAARRWESTSPSGPLIVFVTAFDQFALPAFDTAAIDYLTKPVRFARLAKSLERVRTRLRERAGSMHAEAAAPPGQPDALVTRIGDADVVIPVDRIECVEADGVYAGVWVDKRRLLVRTSLDALEQRLAAATFIRVHRSWLVPTNRVVAIKRSGAACGEGRIVVLASGRSVPVSRRRLGSLRRRLAPASRPGDEPGPGRRAQTAPLR
jgi:two-component system LytT family response regulator